MIDETNIQESPEEYKSKMEDSFSDELVNLINRHSKEGESNTPDFILAQYIEGCLAAYVTATQQRETWHGRDPRPSRTRYGVDMDQPHER